MTRRVFAASVACLIALAPPGLAFAQSVMRMVDSHPAAHAIMDGRNTLYTVMFDAPVDHAGSRLFIERDGQVLHVLQPRLNSQPNTLYAEGRPLPGGSYRLRWSVRGQGHGAGPAQDGSIEFNVRQGG